MVKQITTIALTLTLTGCLFNETVTAVNKTIKTGAEASKTVSEGKAIASVGKSVETFAKTGLKKAETQQEKKQAEIVFNKRILETAIKTQTPDNQILLINRYIQHKEKELQADVDKSSNNKNKAMLTGIVGTLALLILIACGRWLLMWIRPMPTKVIKNYS